MVNKIRITEIEELVLKENEEVFSKIKGRINEGK